MQFHDWDVKKKAKRNPVLNTHRLVLVTGFIFLVLSVSARADTWYELESTNFVVYTTAKEKVARDLLNELEGFRYLVLNFITFDIPPDVDKVKVILFKDLGDFKQYCWDSRVRGYVIPTDTSAIIVQSAQNSVLDSTYVIYHEYVHTLLQHYTGKLPGWYNEGLAELFGATRFKNGKYDVGIAPMDRLREFSRGGAFLSFDDIVADRFKTHRSGPYSDPYVQYWMLAYYFEFGNRERKKELGSYLLLYNDGMDSLQAFQMAFNQTPQEFWHKELKRFYSRRKLKALRIGISQEQLNFQISRKEADKSEVKGTLFLLKINAASQAFQMKDYRNGRRLFQELIDETDPNNKNYLALINGYVWALATSTDNKLRDGKEAVRLGELYIKNKTDKPEFLDTLAAAYAEAGRFDDAIQLQSALLAGLEDADKKHADFARRLESYKNHQPWREGDE